jgi:hypothetical protein
MEQWVIDLLKDSPAYGVIIAIVYLGMKWHERISGQWVSQIKDINDQQRAQSDKWIETIKEIGEKCHEAHEKVATMYYEQGCKALEAWTKLSVNMEHFARVMESKK